MPKHVSARRPLDGLEERHVRQLSHSVHAPADGICHAQSIVRSGDGQRTPQSAQALGCHAQTVRERVHAFNQRGCDGRGMQPGGGRKPRLTQLERSTLLGLVKRPAPGKPTDELTGALEVPALPAEPAWTLATLTAAAQAQGIQLAHSQLRARCAASSTRKASAGAARGCGRRARTWTVPQQGADRRALSRAARGCKGRLRRRAWTGDAHAIFRLLPVGRPLASAGSRRWITSGEGTKAGSMGRCACATARR